MLVVMDRVRAPPTAMHRLCAYAVKERLFRGIFFVIRTYRVATEQSHSHCVVRVTIRDGNCNARLKERDVLLFERVQLALQKDNSPKQECVLDEERVLNSRTASSCHYTLRRSVALSVAAARR